MSYRLLAVPGWGSALTEAMLAACGIQPQIDDVAGFDEPGPARDRLLAVNPLAQLPTLILPDGQVMTESAAITLLLSELHPDAGLAPHPGERDRPAFLRWLVWIVANVYPTFTYSDYPRRFVAHDPDAFARSVDAHRGMLWRQLESQVGPSGTVLDGRFSALDIYVAVMTRWRPRRPWFEVNCPHLYAVALACEARPAIASVLARNFPE